MRSDFAPVGATALFVLGPAAMLLALCGLAQAAEPDRHRSWYVGLDLALSTASDSDVGGSSSGKVAYEPGASLGGLKLGYRPEALADGRGGARFEAELLARGLGVASVTENGRRGDGKGSLGIGALMANAYYDVDTGTAFTPYVGAGIGVAAASFSDNPGLGITDKDSDGTFLAGQLMVGVGYVPESLPWLELSVGYGYFLMEGPSFKTAGGKAEFDDIGVHSVTLGAKYRF